MLRIFSFFLIAMFANFAFAETVRLAWNPQLMRENGEKMVMSEVSYYVLRIDGGAEEVVKMDNIVKDLSAGDHTYAVYLCDTNGMCSKDVVKNFTVKSRPKKPKYPSVSIVK